MENIDGDCQDEGIFAGAAQAKDRKLVVLDGGESTTTITQQQQQHKKRTTSRSSLILPPGRRALYGRDEHQARLLSRFRAMVHGQVDQNELVLITGPAGTGKTALALSLWEAVEKEYKGYFIRGKFDQLQPSGRARNSYAPFVAAFTDYVQRVRHGNDDDSEDELERNELSKKKISEATAGEAGLLINMIPALADLLGEQPEQTPVHGPEAKARFHRVFCKFVSSICSVESPLVLFLDDLQWSDKESVDLLRVLLTDASIEGMMILGACRGNEVALDSDLSVMLRSLEASYDLQVAEIRVSNLAKENVVSLLSDTFPLSKGDCNFLAELVHAHTMGNVFYTIQLIEAVEEVGVVQLPENDSSAASLDKTKLESLTSRIGTDTANLVCQRIRRLPTELQTLLKVAACFGAEFERQVVEIVLKHLRYAWVDGVEGLNLIVRKDAGASRLAFVHDKVQQSCYELIPIDERPSFHLMIGRCLWKAFSRSDEVDNRAGHIVEQLSYGLDLVEDEKERLAIAELCLHTGKRAATSSSFSTAASVFEMGRLLLPRRHWRDYYWLSLHLFSSGAEAEDALGHFEKTDRLVSEVLTNALSLEDKLPALITKIFSLGSRGRIQEAIDAGIEVVEELDEPLPRRFILLRVLLAYVRTSKMLNRLTDNDILNLPLMTETKHLSLMTVLNILLPYTFTGRPDYFPLLAMRLTQLSIKHGLSALSSAGFVLYAVVLVSGFRQVEKGYRFAQLAMKIAEKFDARQWVSRITVCFYGMIVPYVRPVRETIEPLQNAYRLGMASGDTEFGMMGLHFADTARFSSPEPLTDLYSDILSHERHMIAYGQTYVLSYFKPFAQFVANLCGETEDPLVLTGRHLNESEIIAAAKRENNATGLIIMYALKANIAIMLNDYERAQSAVFEFRSCSLKAGPLIVHWIAAFVMGVSSFKLAAKSTRGRRRRKREGWRCLKMLRKYAETSPSTLLHRVHFLEAEASLLEGDIERCRMQFDLASRFAEQAGVLGDQAFATEHCGIALLQHGTKEDGCQQLLKARELYRGWGATVKVDQIDSMLKTEKVE